MNRSVTPIPSARPADATTGLPTSGELLAGLEQRVAAGRNRMAPLGLIAVHIDRMPFVDHDLGPQVGDLLARAVSERLAGCARLGDVVARRSREQFLLLLDPLPSPEVAASVASKICQVIARGFAIDGRTIAATASCGIGLYPQDADTPEGVFEQAEQALDRSRLSGDCFHFAEAVTDATTSSAAALEEDPRTAFEHDAFELHYQPRIEPVSGRVTGFEALMRWQDAQQGWISPARFIPLAESTGLIHDLGAWALATACGHAARCRRMAVPESLRVSVNVSGRQFQRADLYDRIARILERTGLAPHRLELEITESALLHHPEQLLGTFRDLRALGVRLALDDFGTGYSAIGYLRQFPLDVLKIDRTFVVDAETDPGVRALVRAMIDMAHALGLSVVGEGVETAAQRTMLVELGCDEIQGFLVAPGLPPERCAPFLEPGARF